MSVPTLKDQPQISLVHPEEPARSRFVDGLRALCALFVVEHHIFYEMFDSRQWALIDPSLQVATKWLRHGHISVAGFIVLSGFCLMTPVVVSNSKWLHGGIKGFIARRARRILPPYYAALLLSIFLLIVVPGFRKCAGYHWDWSLPALKTNTILSHLFLVHNFNPDWNTKINHPLWSIAIEWQIYFVFALLLIPIRARFGIVTAVAAAILLGVIPEFVFHTADWTRPWYLGLFALGMMAATVARSGHKAAVEFSSKLPWGGLALTLVSVEVWCAWSEISPVLDEVITALALTCCLVWGANFDRERATWMGKSAMRILASSPLVGAGLFSYSLYLVHAPVIALLRMGLVDLNLSPTVTYELLLVLATILSLVAGYAFFLLAEKRFLRKKS
jgi:peptidoglycan/LPS O-acetylase OafA/YrhL